MNNWKNIKVINCEGYSTFFSEEFGLATGVDLQCFLLDKEGRRLCDVYANYNPNTRKISEDLYRVYEYSIETLFDLKFYRYKPEAPRNYYYGGMPNPIRLDCAEEISDVRYEVVQTLYVDKRYKSEEKRFIISKKEELQNITIWATKDRVAYEMPVLMDLQEGQKYYYVDQGVCEVIKVYKYPDKQSKNICRVVFADCKEKDIAVGDKNFVYIPLNFESELLQFNKNLNELVLQPVIQKNQANDLINVMWQPVEEAARYVVKLYRYVNTENGRKVYFLKDYEIDRNEHFLSINDLIINGHIVVVVAENRAGYVVAQSRGIDVEIGKPKWF